MYTITHYLTECRKAWNPRLQAGTMLASNNLPTPAPQNDCSNANIPEGLRDISAAVSTCRKSASEPRELENRDQQIAPLCNVVLFLHTVYHLLLLQNRVLVDRAPIDPEVMRAPRILCRVGIRVQILDQSSTLCMI